MEWLKKLGKIIIGSISGSCLVLLNQTTPMDLTRDSYTLEQLAYQDNHRKEVSEQNEWSFRWVADRRFVLLQGGDGATGNHLHPVGLRRAVHRSVVGR